ncbi:Vgr family type VI secretion protein (plasmid) [Candidatus Trichorickettsia mobilis]|uniref:type VI secretion system Vgr family protein n=1 Tax=Candidatus Trichorickettsia mobilis TaxID=1346319 RepID=UPI002B25F6D3|nr:type VI secretion system tip protein TssI/VgrG [Candidatus Trichorickettsia mobilis]WPY01678.1 Vgr family type VI secretion protein [Candidatus Trichorickettsia mobilis]
MNGNFSHGQKLNLKLLGEWDNQDLYGRIIKIQALEEISELFNYRLTLFTVNKEIMAQALCGKIISFAISSTIDTKKTIERTFSGIVNKAHFSKRQNPKASANHEFEYCLEVVPQLFNATMVKHSRIFHAPEQKLLTIIETVLKNYKIDYECNIKNSEELIAENCIQYNESDYEFIYRLLYAAGLYYFFKHVEQKHIMVISNQLTSYSDLDDKSVKHIYDKGNILSLHNISFQYSNHITDYTVKAFSYANPEKIVESTYSKVSHQVQVPLNLQNEEIIYTYEIKDTAQITKFAENNAIKDQYFSKSIEGTSTYMRFTIGKKFNLQGKFFEHLKTTEYVIIKLAFEVSENISEQQYLNNFVAIASDTIFAAIKPICKPVIQGLHFALVVNGNGESSSQEPYCDEKGRVYIKLLWGNDSNICKANILSTSNSFTLPRIGSLAYVLFPHNNMYNDIPVIVGISNEGLMDFNNKEEWYKNIYMTYPASSEASLYNFISFKDKKDEQEVKVQARKDMYLEIENNRLSTIKNDSTESIKNIRTITIEEGNDILEVNKGDILIKVKEGNYHLSCKAKVCINSEDQIQIDAKSDLSIKSGGKINIESVDGIYINTKGKYEVKSQGDAAIDATGNVTVKSSQNINNKAGMAAAYEAGTSINIKSNAKASIDSAVTEIKGKATVKVNAPFTNISM